MPRNFINWSCKLTLYQRERDGGGGQPPVKSEVRAQNSKVGRLWFLAGRCSRISRGTPEAWSRLCICRASFLMTFATGGVPHAGSWHLVFPILLFSSISLQPRQHIKKQRHYFANKGPFSQGYGFSSGHVWMWELNYKESWALKNWCFWPVVLEKTLERPLDCMEIQPAHPKEDRSWVFTGRTDVEAETPILWPPDAKSWLIGKDPDAGKVWG